MELPFPAYKGSDPFAFVSYAHRDDHEVYPDLEWLHEQGANIWYDEGIRVGSSWRDEIANAIESCSILVFFVSRQALESENCLREVSYALDIGRPVLPVFLAPLELPAGLRLSLGHRQAINRHRHDRDDYLIKLLEVVRQGSPDASGDTMSRNIVSRYEVPNRRTSIAVLPFRNLGSDPEHDFLAEGISTDCSTMLSRIKDLFVISRNSTQGFTSGNASYRAVGEELGVVYLVDGSVRVAGNRLRVSVQLINASSEATLWAQKIDRTIEDLFEVQDAITESLVAQLLPNLRISEGQRAEQVAIDAWSLFQKAWAKWNFNYTRAASDEAVQLLNESLKIEPRYADSMAALGVIHANRVAVGWTEQLSELGDALQHITACLELEPNNALGLYAHAVFRNVTGERKLALEYIERAVEIEPCNSNFLALAGVLTASQKDEDAGIALCEHALRLSPMDPRIHMLYATLGIALFWCGRYEAMREANANSLHAREQGNIYGAFGLLIAELHLGNEAGALEALEKAKRATATDLLLLSRRMLDPSPLSDPKKIAVAEQSGALLEDFLTRHL